MQLDDIEKAIVLGGCSYSIKKEIILENRFNFKHDFMYKIYIIKVVSSIKSACDLIDFVNNNKDFFEKNNLNFFDVTSKIGADTAKELYYRIDKLDFSDEYKRKIIASFSNEAKDKISKGVHFSEDEKVLLGIKSINDDT